MSDIGRYLGQSVFSDPGEFAPWLAALPPDLPALHYAASQLVFHYGHRDQFERHGINADRLGEIDTRYADDMLRLVRSLDDAPLGTRREPAQRMVGCCRDDTLFLVAMARQHGIPARSRVGFTTYFTPGWSLDHVVAEIWDDAQDRWRLVDANLDAGHTDPTDGQVLDVLDLPRDRFLVAPDAWQRCRFVVSPDRPESFLRGWPYLIHNLLTDLAALGQQELILWDVWGLGSPEAEAGDDDLALLDALAADLMAGEPDAATIDRWLGAAPFRIPNPIPSWSPAASGQPRTVQLRD